MERARNEWKNRRDGKRRVVDVLAVTLCCHLLLDRNSSSPGEFLPSAPSESEHPPIHGKKKENCFTICCCSLWLLQDKSPATATAAAPPVLRFVTPSTVARRGHAGVMQGSCWGRGGVVEGSVPHSRWIPAGPGSSSLSRSVSSVTPVNQSPVTSQPQLSLSLSGRSYSNRTLGSPLRNNWSLFVRY